MQNLDELHLWCSLWRTPQVGCKRFAKILEVFGEPRAFFSAPQNQRERLSIRAGLDDLNLAKKEAEKDIKWLETTNKTQILTLFSPDYPKQLLNIYDPPPLLFTRGDVSLLSEPQLAIVGSRSPSYEGSENAFSFAKYLAQSGVVITSGMALGIDGNAHSGALDVEFGRTIAVAGTGLNRIYPAKHKDLAHKIIEKGIIISELPIDTPVRAQAFPRRNRIISGLSLGTLVVEASIKSGSLITAQFAIEHNREVFAIPGSIHNPQSKGCNHLIKKGAKLVETGADIFTELKPQLAEFTTNMEPIDLQKVDKNLDKNLKSDLDRDIKNTSSSSKYKFKVEKQQKITKNKETEINQNIAQRQPLLDDEAKKSLWKALSFDAQPIDILIARSKLPANEVSSMLLIF